MRYTTIIDISELPLYRNKNAVLLYLHLALKSGYHDHDRDQLRASLRGLAAATGLTLSATRHAISILTQSKLLTRDGDTWKVLKWVQTESITTRPRTKSVKAEMQAATAIIDKYRQDEQDRLEKERKAQQAVEEYRARSTDYHREFVEKYELLEAKKESERTIVDNSKLSRNRRWYLISREVLKERESELE